FRQIDPQRGFLIVERKCQSGSSARLSHGADFQTRLVRCFLPGLAFTHDHQRRAAGHPQVRIKMKEQRRGRVVAAIYEAHALSSIVSAVVKVERKLDLISQTLVRGSWLVYLRMSGDRQYERCRKEKGL